MLHRTKKDTGFRKDNDKLCTALFSISAPLIPKNSNTKKKVNNTAQAAGDDNLRVQEVAVNFF